MSEKTFYDMTCEAIAIIDGSAAEDQARFNDLYRFLKQSEDKKNHTRVSAGHGVANVYYREASVFAFRVESGAIIVMEAGEAPRQFTDKSEALRDMARIMAEAVVAAHREDEAA